MRYQLTTWDYCVGIGRTVAIAAIDLDWQSSVYVVYGVHYFFYPFHGQKY